MDLAFGAVSKNNLPNPVTQTFSYVPFCASSRSKPHFATAHITATSLLLKTYISTRFP